MLGKFMARIGAHSRFMVRPPGSQGRWARIVVLCALTLSFSAPGFAAASGTPVGIDGVVLDTTGAVIPDMTVEILNPVTQFTRSTTTDGEGKFSFPNIPPNIYHLTVTGPGFVSYVQDVDVHNSLPVSLKITMQVGAAAQTVTVQSEAGDLVETDSTFHTDVDRQLFEKMPLESSSSQLSSLVTLATPGVSSDSNGMFHGMGEHADNSFSLDGQPITDQQSKTFSNQIPLDAVQSMEVIAGAPPAEYGDKTSLVIDVTTRSGLGSTTPHGNITASYGTFGSSDLGAALSYGGKQWGNFISGGGSNTGRFLDTPEFVVFHAHGNQENFFDRFDYVFSANDAMHINAGYTRSWFQTPNSYDSQNYGVLGPDGNLVGPADQRSKILSLNVAPSWTHTVSNNAVFTLVGFVRRDDVNYYRSDNPFADLSPIQSSSIAQQRSLMNAGARADFTYAKGINNIKVGVSYTQTFLDENDQVGIVSPTANAPCVDASGNPVAGFNDPSQCSAAGYAPNPSYTPIVSCYDLTRPFPSPSSGCASPHSTFYPFVGHTDVKELALYVQDNITYKNWNFSLGIRGDLYNGLTTASQAEPRLGLAYNIHKTNTVLRLSYARTMETPFNENLVLSSTGCFYPVIAALVPCVPSPLDPGYRNEFHAGLQQALGKYVVVSGEYIWKYTHNAYDFSVLDNTPITFPIAWHNSKIPGWAIRVSVPNYHGFSALAVMSSVTARFFPPQTGGLGTTVEAGGYPFRIDHDEHFNQTLHFQYQPKPNLPWVGFNWRFDSGQVAGAAPCYGVSPSNTCPDSTTLPDGSPAVDLSGLSADQQFQGGLFCGNIKANPYTPLPSPCPVALYGSTLLSIPAPNAQNNDKNPARMVARNLFDISAGDDNLFNGDRCKWSLQVTIVNLTNDYALYNYLSTFSGTHYVSPRTVTAQLGFHF
jgi:Carboxypeptidase regulatory-like domain/TonB-dependent Receptor Plug Domain